MLLMKPRVVMVTYLLSLVAQQAAITAISGATRDDKAVIMTIPRFQCSDIQYTPGIK